MRPETSIPNGYVLYEQTDITVIATLKSENAKTGNMAQVWILNRSESPVESVRSGSDANVCFDCPHRGTGFADRTCYVNVAQGPNAVWRAYQNGKYPFLATTAYASVFTGRKIRLGAYGEPVLIPLAILRALTEASAGWTGYTHQWRKPEFEPYRAYVMASCDSPADAAEARTQGWRTFRVRTPEQPLRHGEISCPASDEMNHRTQCVRCGLCNGARANDPRKDIAIIVHGIGARNFVRIQA